MVMTQKQRDTVRSWKSYLAVFTLKTICALLLLLFLVWLNLGCARVSYQTDKGEKFTYTRLGNQKLHGVEVKAGDKSLKLKSSQGSSGDFAVAIKNLSERIPVMKHENIDNKDAVAKESIER